MKVSDAHGRLWLVATPIGNLKDFSQRGAEVLAQVDQIACEDTRITKRLLNFLDLNKPLVSYREENEKVKSLELVELIKSGQSIALVSDAGYPGISDPGFRLVRECRRRKIEVCPIPGANAAITTLAASGLPTHQFLYLGFLPKKSAAAQRVFEQWKEFEGSIVIYESKYRIEKTLLGVHDTLGPDRFICISRELTKIHETFYIGTVLEILERMKTSSSKGEFTMVIAPDGYTL
jgi:16S rRNA (cytidine1402-2'-O)-methyltransferase